jgi:hypothetical protein
MRKRSTGAMKNAPPSGELKDAVTPSEVDEKGVVVRSNSGASKVNVAAEADSTASKQTRSDTARV